MAGRVGGVYRWIAYFIIIFLPFSRHLGPGKGVVGRLSRVGPRRPCLAEGPLFSYCLALFSYPVEVR